LCREGKGRTADALIVAAVRAWYAWLLPGLPAEETDELLHSIAVNAAEAYRKRRISPPKWVNEISR
jgi:hypothetical protein